jgi:hypothetical protein
LLLEVDSSGPTTISHSGKSLALSGGREGWQLKVATLVRNKGTSEEYIWGSRDLCRFPTLTSEAVVIA